MGFDCEKISVFVHTLFSLPPVHAVGEGEIGVVGLWEWPDTHLPLDR